MDLTDLVVGILLTAIAYMAFPVIRLLINHGRFEKKRARKIALWNSIICGLIFCVATVESGAIWNAAPAVIYYWINCTLLTTKTKEGNDCADTGGSKPETGSASRPPQLSDASEEPKTYGNYNIYGRDVAVNVPLNDPLAELEREYYKTNGRLPNEETAVHAPKKEEKQEDLTNLNSLLSGRGREFKKAKGKRMIIATIGFAIFYFVIMMLFVGETKGNEYILYNGKMVQKAPTHQLIDGEFVPITSSQSSETTYIKIKGELIPIDSSSKDILEDGYQRGEVAKLLLGTAGDTAIIVESVVISLILACIHVWANNLIFGHLSQKGREESEVLDNIRKRISEVKKN